MAAGTAEAIFEKLPLDNLLKMKTTGGVRAGILAMLRQSGIEATEEVATTIADTLADAIINGSRSVYEASVSAYIRQGDTRGTAQRKAAADWGKGLLLDALGGLLSGALLGGTVSALQHAKSGDLRTRELGRLLQSEGAENSVLEYACKTSELDSDIFAQAFALDGDRINRQPIAPEKLGKLYEDLVERDANQPDLTDIHRQDIIGTKNDNLVNSEIRPRVYFEEVTPPGSDHPVTVYTDGYAQINRGKIDVFMRGKVKLENETALRTRRAELYKAIIRQPSLFASELIKEYDKVDKLIHAYERSLEMNVSLKIAGIPDTEDYNLFLATQILQSAREATTAKPIVNCLIQAPNCELRVESRWVIDNNGKPYLKTIILSPHNKERKNREQY